MAFLFLCPSSNRYPCFQANLSVSSLHSIDIDLCLHIESEGPVSIAYFVRWMCVRRLA